MFSADTAFFPAARRFRRAAPTFSSTRRCWRRASTGWWRAPATARGCSEHLLASHTLAADAGRIAAEAGVRRLVLNHLIPADDPAIGEADWVSAVRKSWQGALTIGRDGLVVPIQAASRQGGNA